MNETKRCFEPVVDDATRLLILGSLPSEQSLLKGEYYGNKQNKFWELIGAVIGADLRALPYGARLDSLRAHGVGLWDVVAEAKREGSLDSQIRERLNNDLTGLVAGLPQLAAIAFNGGTAARHGVKALGQDAQRYQIVPLPSSSPAYTLAYAEKLKAWSSLSEFLPRWQPG
jgi:hypoxanthine-DNA glycosylase